MVAVMKITLLAIFAAVHVAVSARLDTDVATGAQLLDIDDDSTIAKTIEFVRSKSSLQHEEANRQSLNGDLGSDQKGKGNKHIAPQENVVSGSSNPEDDIHGKIQKDTCVAANCKSSKQTELKPESNKDAHSSVNSTGHQETIEVTGAKVTSQGTVRVDHPSETEASKNSSNTHTNAKIDGDPASVSVESSARSTTSGDSKRGGSEDKVTGPNVNTKRRKIAGPNKVGNSKPKGTVPEATRGDTKASTPAGNQADVKGEQRTRKTVATAKRLSKAAGGNTEAQASARARAEGDNNKTSTRTVSNVTGGTATAQASAEARSEGKNVKTADRKVPTATAVEGNKKTHPSEGTQSKDKADTKPKGTAIASADTRPEDKTAKTSKRTVTKETNGSGHATAQASATTRSEGETDTMSKRTVSTVTEVDIEAQTSADTQGKRIKKPQGTVPKVTDGNKKTHPSEGTRSEGKTDKKPTGTASKVKGGNVKAEPLASTHDRLEGKIGKKPKGAVPQAHKKATVQGGGVASTNTELHASR